MQKIEILSQGRKGVENNLNRMKNWRDYATAGFIAAKMNKEFNQVLDHVKKNNIKTFNELRDYLSETGIRKRHNELYDQCMEINKKIRENKSWNGRIYTYKNGDRAVFLNNEKVVLNDDEYEFLKVVAT